jgi:hypothetical protein
MLNNLNMICPKKQNMAMIVKATVTALNATLLIIFGSASPTMVKKTGVFPMGFKMAKKPINTVVNSKITSDIEFIMAENNCC